LFWQPIFNGQLWEMLQALTGTRRGNNSNASQHHFVTEISYNYRVVQKKSGSRCSL